MKIHPALSLFKELFDEAAKDLGPTLPTYFVVRPVFHKACIDRGIPIPENWPDAIRWEEEIGLPEFAHKIIAAYHKAHGTDFTPMEKGAWRLYRKQRKLKG